MLDRLAGLHPVLQALLAGLFTWALTALGATLVLFTTRISRRLFDGMLGFAGGVMLAASYWSLLAPGIEIAREQSTPPWLPAAAGFLLGAAAMWGLDRSLPHLHPGLPPGRAEGPPTAWQHSVLLVLAITLHNIPEGLAVGVARCAASPLCAQLRRRSHDLRGGRGDHPGGRPAGQHRPRDTLPGRRLHRHDDSRRGAGIGGVAGGDAPAAGRFDHGFTISAAGARRVARRSSMTSSSST